MTTIRLTVNGEPCSADVPDRTQLAELLRDHLHLTGTHLGCEHGVCGACTVLVHGRPIRSCITYAHACEGASVVTVEGLGDDPTGRALREAFARHHALQCGFCTPGMLITAWDIITRLAPVGETAIRHELSGNLCRCTGYMGIVAAVRDVAQQHWSGAPDGARSPTAAVASAGGEAAVAGDGIAKVGEASVAPAARSGGETGRAGARQDEPGESAASTVVAFEPFEVDPVHRAVADTTATGSRATGDARAMTQRDGWTLIEREFVMEHPVDALWTLFEDLPRIAECLPGVRVDSTDGNRFAGRAEIRFGPIRAAFRGEGTREIDTERRTGAISGRGSDPPRTRHPRCRTALRDVRRGIDRFTASNPHRPRHPLPHSGRPGPVQSRRPRRELRRRDALRLRSELRTKARRRNSTRSRRRWRIRAGVATSQGQDGFVSCVFTRAPPCAKHCGTVCRRMERWRKSDWRRN